MTKTAKKTFNNVVRGVAIGDAWGNPNEFRNIDSLTANNPRGPELPDELTITDDTQMTLFLADALDWAYAENMDMAGTKQAIIDAYLDYYHDPDNDGKRAPGITVMGSLGSLARAKTTWQEATSRYSDGSGTVMRTSAVAFLGEDRWVGVAAFGAAVTHGTPNGVAAAILNVAVLRELLEGTLKPGHLVTRARHLAAHARKEGLLETGEWLEGFMDADKLAEGFETLVKLLDTAQERLPALTKSPWVKGSDPSLHIRTHAHKGGGWRAQETLVIAMMAVDMLAGQPLSALRRSVTTDGDSDTIGAVAGALIGAAYDDVFTDLWGKIRDRFEPRFVRWIEIEADDYKFADEHKTPWLKRLVGRK